MSERDIDEKIKQIANMTESERADAIEKSITRELLLEVITCMMKNGIASTSFIQRKFCFGYNKAAKIMDKLESLDFVGPFDNAKPRKIKITPERFKEYFGVEYEG